MKATIEQSALLKCLGHIQRLVDRRVTVPILANVLLTAERDRLVARGTNMDSEITASVSAQVATNGALTVPAHLLYDIVRKMPAGSQIAIEQDGETLIVKAGRSRFKVPTLPVSDFPELAMTDGVRFDLPGADLRRLIGKTQFAISTEETRYYLNGIYLHIAQAGDFMLRAVATDGHRLARVDAALPDGAEDMPGVIVPRDTVDSIWKGKLFDDAETISIEVNASKIAFAAGDLRIVSKLIDGTFPDYGRVIPQNNEKKLVVDKAALEAAVDRVSVVGGKESRAVKMSISTENVELSFRSADFCDAADEIEAEYYDEPIEIGFNHNYVRDILKELGDRAMVKLGDPGSPTIFRDPDDGSTLFVLMPMRV